MVDKENKVSTRVSDQCWHDMDSLIKKGYAINRSEFVRDALKEHIKNCSLKGKRMRKQNVRRRERTD